MPEPVTTSAAGIGSTMASNALFKLAVYGFGPAFAAIVVMMMTPPKSVRQFAVMLIATVFSSMLLGAYIIDRLFGMPDIHTIIGVMQIGGVFFACGLPGWVIVRAWFIYADQNSKTSLITLIRDIKDAVFYKQSKREQGYYEQYPPVVDDDDSFDGRKAERKEVENDDGL